MRVRSLVLLVASALVLAACGSSADPATTTGPPVEQSTVTVFAAASLTESFTEIAQQFEAANPGVKVVLSFGPSSGLATQITDKAPADVFASASKKTMQTVKDAGFVSSSKVFAVNTMAIATPKDPSVPVTSLDDLADPSVKVAICAEDVPCGVAADALFKKNDLVVKPVTREVDVKSVLSKVQLGEVDAGVVYVTDVKAAGDAVGSVTIPEKQNVTTDYPIAVIDESVQAALAKKFVAFVLSPAGQNVLTAAGFASP